MPFAQSHRAPLVALLCANAVSLVGSALTAVALPWFVLQSTGSAAKTGIAAVGVAAPPILAGVFGGALVDRLGYKRVSLGADLVSGVAIALIPLLGRTTGLAFWQLVALIVTGALLTLPGNTARRAMLPELARQGGWRLDRVNATFEAIQYLALLLGPPLAGLLIAALGPSRVLWIDAATFFVSLLLVAGAVPAHRSTTASTERYIAGVVSGIRFLRRDSVLLTLLASLVLTNGLRDPIFTVILPVYTEREFGRALVLGVLVAASGTGSLLGTSLYAAAGHKLSRRGMWLLAYLTSTAPFWALAVWPALPVVVAACLLNGLASGPIAPLVVTVRHERIPSELRGRVFSLFSALTRLGSPLGVLLAGALLQRVGLRPAMLLWAVAAQLVGIGMIFVPAFRALDPLPDTGGAEA